MNPNRVGIIKPIPVHNKPTFVVIHFRRMRNHNETISVKILKTTLQTNIDLILQASNQLKHPENWEFFELTHAAQ